MLSKSQKKLINALAQKKQRLAHGLFVVEGLKSINEFINAKYELQQLFTTNENNNNATPNTIVSDSELKSISFLKTPNKALALFKMKQNETIDTSGLVLALDAVRDPGNLGTIIRLCDWFGIKQLLCNFETVDCYNPKVVQATMGSLARVAINYVDLPQFLDAQKSPVFGTFMDGENVYKTALPLTGILVMGNEANGISKQVETQITKRIAIPRYGAFQATESLNVATATAIFLSEFKRGN